MHFLKYFQQSSLDFSYTLFTNFFLFPFAPEFLLPEGLAFFHFLW